MCSAMLRERSDRPTLFLLRARGCPLHLLVSRSDDLMRIIELDEMSVDRAGERAVIVERASGVDVHREVLPGRLRAAGERQRPVLESAGELKRRAVRVV